MRKMFIARMAPELRGRQGIVARENGMYDLAREMDMPMHHNFIWFGTDPAYEDLYRAAANRTNPFNHGLSAHYVEHDGLWGYEDVDIVALMEVIDEGAYDPEGIYSIIGNWNYIEYKEVNDRNHIWRVDLLICEY